MLFLYQHGLTTLMLVSQYTSIEDINNLLSHGVDMDSILGVNKLCATVMSISLIDFKCLKYIEKGVSNICVCYVILFSLEFHSCNMWI